MSKDYSFYGVIPTIKLMSLIQNLTYTYHYILLVNFKSKASKMKIVTKFRTQHFKFSFEM